MHSGHEGAEKVASEIAPACVFLSKARFGAIIVIERRVGLKALVEGGTVLNATLTAPLIQTIFHPGTALHDLAVVIRGDKVHSAGVQLPMASASEILDQSLGSRHRAAIGVTKETDALVIVVSEETGYIRIAERGALSNPIEPGMLKEIIRENLGQPMLPPAESKSEEAMPKSGDASGFADDVSVDQGNEPEPNESLLSKDTPQKLAKGGNDE